MKRFLPFLLLALMAVSGSSQTAQRIYLTITVTNPPVTSNTLVVNASTRTWTNSSTATTIATNLTTVNAAATNLFNQIASYPYSGALIHRWLNTNQIEIRAPIGGALAASSSGTWATLTLNTQSGPETITALWPIENIVGATNRTNQASAFVGGLSSFSTQAFATNAAAVSNLVHKGVGPRQRVYTELEVQNILAAAFAQITNANLVNATNRGYVVAITNGYWTNATLAHPISTNLVNRGGAISSPGTNGVGSEQFGTGARATNESALAVGRDAVALGPFSTATGNEAEANGYGDSAFGYAAVSSGGNGFAAGAGAVVSGTNGTAIGTLATVTHANSTAIGFGVESSASNQVAIGNSVATVLIAGQLQAATQTNSVLRGTNVLDGRIDLTSRANTSLANGYNSGVLVGTNAYVRFSGPSGAYTNVGFTAPGGPQFVVMQFDNPGLSFTLLDESGLEATAANRILTGTGALLNSTNRTVNATAIYDDTASRWRILSFR